MNKENLKSVFWVPEFGHPNWYTGLPNGLDMSLSIDKSLLSLLTEIYDEKELMVHGAL